MSNSAKRPTEDGGSSSDDDFGPAPLAGAVSVEDQTESVKPARKKMRKLEFQHV